MGFPINLVTGGFGLDKPRIGFPSYNNTIILTVYPQNLGLTL